MIKISYFSNYCTYKIHYTWLLDWNIHNIFFGNLSSYNCNLFLMMSCIRNLMMSYSSSHLLPLLLFHYIIQCFDSIRSCSLYRKNLYYNSCYLSKNIRSIASSISISCSCISEDSEESCPHLIETICGFVMPCSSFLRSELWRLTSRFAGKSRLAGPLGWEVGTGHQLTSLAAQKWVSAGILLIQQTWKELFLNFKFKHLLRISSAQI